MKVIDLSRAWWKAHGTKIYGGLVIASGSAGEALVYIQQLDPKHAALWAVIIVMGAGIIKRGFYNSRQPQ